MVRGTMQTPSDRDADRVPGAWLLSVGENNFGGAACWLAAACHGSYERLPNIAISCPQIEYSGSLRRNV